MKARGTRLRRGWCGPLGLAAVAALTAVTGCGGANGSGGKNPALVISGRAPATPYAGPLRVADHPAGDLRARAGAAGLALECDGDISSGGSGDRWSEGDGGSTPAGGLAAYFDMQQPDVPRHGYRVERAEPDRVLFSFDVHGRTKVAVVVAKDGPGRPGWGPESSASCDPSELPAAFTDRQPYEIWSDADGRRVPLSRVSSSPGPAHCGWQTVHFLEVGAPSGAHPALYARDPKGVLPAGMLTAPYRGHTTLPRDARDTGYHLGDQSLWLSPDGSLAYIRRAGSVEAWPAVAPGNGCA
jgi:hypothetical protein